MRLTIAAFLLLLIPTVRTAAQTNPPGTIEGVVVRAGTGEPIAGAEVSRTSNLDPPNMFNGPNPNPPVLTDSNGKFTFKDLKPATYRIFVTANGFIRQENGQRAVYGAGKPIYLADGTSVANLSIALTPSALVTGRVLTDTGQPASDILVQLVRTLYGSQGRIFTGAGMANADDRGEFRIFGVVPGEYYLVAGNARLTQPIAPGAGDAISIRLSRATYGMTFYPGVSDLGSATRLELKPGAEVRVNLTVPSQEKGYRISGRVVDLDNGTSAAAPNIALMPPNPQSTVQTVVTPRNTSTVPGTFEFLNVTPGTWTIRADVRVPVQPGIPGAPVDQATIAARATAQAMSPFGQATLQVSNANIDGVVVNLRSGAILQARIQLDNDQAIGSVSNLDRISLGLVPTDGLPGNMSATRPSEDGTFQIAGVREGDYTLRVGGLPPGYYVKSARYGGEDAWNKPLHFSGTDPARVEVTIRAGAVQISGTVADSKNQPVSGIQAVLIPEQSARSTVEPIRTVVTDSSGRFTIASVAPGNYRIFSWESSEPNIYYDPERMKRSESLGLALRIEDSVNPTIQVKMIPAE